MGIDSEALHQDAMKQQAARFEERIGELLSERNAAQREVATLQSERERVFKTLSDTAIERDNFKAERDTAIEALAKAEADCVKADAEEHERMKALECRLAEAFIERDKFKAERDAAQQELTQLKFQANQAAINAEAHGGSVTTHGWYDRFTEFRRTFIGEYGNNIEHVAEVVFDAVAAFLEKEARLVDAEFYDVVTEAERDVVLERLERLIDIGDDLAAMLSESLGEVRAWREVSAAAKAAPQMKQHKSVKEAHRARCNELTAHVRSLSEAVKKAGPLQPRIAVLEARLAAACSWIEHLGQYVTNDELVKAAAEFVRNESEVPF